MERRTRIMQEFSLWAAMSAARQGSPVRGKKLYQYLAQVDFRLLLDNTAVTEDEFSAWHKDAVTRLTEASRLPVGWSAKLINMVLKVRVYVGREGPPDLLPLIHPPIDTRLINAVLDRYPNREAENAELRRLCARGKPISGVKTYRHYLEVVSGFRLVAGHQHCTLFEVESLWSGQDDSDDLA